jgi:hypothetical protein
LINRIKNIHYNNKKIYLLLIIYFNLLKKKKCELIEKQKKNQKTFDNFANIFYLIAKRRISRNKKEKNF